MLLKYIALCCNGTVSNDRC